MSSANPPAADPPPLPPGPAEEIAIVWRALPGKGLVVAVTLAWIALFHFLGNATFGYIDTRSLFGWLNYVYNLSQDDEIGRYMPLIVLGLCWWKRDEILAVPKSPWAGGLALVALALFVHLLGFVVQQTRLSVLAFYLGLYGLLGTLWGRQFLRATFFPWFLLIFCVPLGTMADTITFPLRLLATRITTGFGEYLLGIDLIQNGTQILDARGSYQYEVAAACGGLRSLTATLALASIYACLVLPRPGRRLPMILAAFPLAVAGNVLRLVTIIVTAEAFGQKGGDWVHENAILSLLPYVPAFLGLGALGAWLRDKPAPHPQPARPTPALADPQSP